MALKKTVTHRGVEVPDCYIKVARYVGTKSSLSVVVDYKAGADAEPLYDESYFVEPFELYADNPVRQAYLYLKTLPEFAGAVDC
ncbi:hypothetical protein [Pigmentiphaga sp. CHJ604]|uniref:hypothetical protein n=1 Tax=Pigmentiphaga sp. CHJ604 TaxID=3081984 RepID=UPI0030CEC224